MIHISNCARVEYETPLTIRRLLVKSLDNKGSLLEDKHLKIYI